jgi:hypothetical protein
MNDLLQVAVDARGGLSRWNQLLRLKQHFGSTLSSHTFARLNFNPKS